mgnify:CR=1 FL=1
MKPTPVHRHNGGNNPAIPPAPTGPARRPQTEVPASSPELDAITCHPEITRHAGAILRKVGHNEFLLHQDGTIVATSLTRRQAEDWIVGIRVPDEFAKTFRCPGLDVALLNDAIKKALFLLHSEDYLEDIYEGCIKDELHEWIKDGRGSLVGQTLHELRGAAESLTEVLYGQKEAQ